MQASLDVAVVTTRLRTIAPYRHFSAKTSVELITVWYKSQAYMQCKEIAALEVF